MWQLKIQYFGRFWSILADFGWFWWYCRDFIAKSTQIAFMTRYITINKAENANSGRFWVSGADFGLSELDFGLSELDFGRFAHPDFRFGRFWHLGAQSGRFWWFLRFLKLCPLFIGIGFSVLEGPERLFAPLFSPKYSISHVSVHRGYEICDIWGYEICDIWGVWDMWYMRYRVYDIWDIAIAIAKAIAIARYTVYRLYGYSYSYS